MQLREKFRRLQAMPHPDLVRLEQEMERIGKRLPGVRRAYSAQQLEILATIAGQES